LKDPLFVVNADDFGMHPAVNRAVQRAHQEGVLTSASLMPCGAAFEEAVQISRDSPSLGVGVHLTLIEERPLTGARSLIDGDGRLPKTYRDFANGWATGRIRRDDVFREIQAQLARLTERGLRPSHLDSHQHVHCLPGLWSATVGLARRHGIRFVRLPWFDSYGRNARSPIESGLRLFVNALARTRRILGDGGLHEPAWTRGLDFSGRMTAADMRRIIATPCAGINEIVVHPAEPDADFTAKYSAGNWRGFDGPGDLAAVLAADASGDLRAGGARFTNFATLSS
jgi:predicted glycoside hydrolase/deacetylase ChbG (UPF0249 family)